MSEPDSFRHCSTCKRPIAFKSGYFRCSVSTCNRRPLEMFFCSVPCWDAHVPEARHRDAWAEAAEAPSRAEWEAMKRDEPELADKRRVVVAAAPRAAVVAAAPRAIVVDESRQV